MFQCYNASMIQTLIKMFQYFNAIMLQWSKHWNIEASILFSEAFFLNDQSPNTAPSYRRDSSHLPLTQNSANFA